MNQALLRLADAVYVYAEGKAFMFRYEQILVCTSWIAVISGLMFTICYCVKKASEHD